MPAIRQALVEPASTLYAGRLRNAYLMTIGEFMPDVQKTVEAFREQGAWALQDLNLRAAPLTLKWGGDDKTNTKTFNQDVVVVGRLPTCDVVIGKYEELDCSRVHALIFSTLDGIFVLDMGSLTGIFTRLRI